MANDAKKTQNKASNKKEVKKVVNEKNSKGKEKALSNKKNVVEEEATVKTIVNKKEPSKLDDKFDNMFKKLDNYRLAIILFIVGFLLATLIFRCIFWPDRIATLNDGTQPVATLKDEVITADKLYEEMKQYYSVNILLNTVDDLILSKLYPSTDEMEEEIKSTAEYYYSIYESNYGYTKEAFLSQYGFSNEAAFLDSLRLDNRKNLYYEDYALSLVTDKEVEKYYNDEVFGDVDSKHILVSISDDGLSDAEAKKMAEEIISKLNSGTSWDDVINEYKDNIISEELGYNAFNASLESSYLKECKDLAVGTYSKTPVLTSYGYHIVYKIAQKDKPKLEDVKDDIKDILAKEKKEADSNLFYKALIKMREDAELEFADTKLADEYAKYISQYK